MQWADISRKTFRYAVLAIFISSLSLEAGSINVQQLRPTAGFHYALTEDAFFWAPGAEKSWRDDGLMLGVQLNYLTNGLVQFDAVNQRKTILAGSMTTFDINAAKFFAKDLILGADVSASMVSLSSEDRQGVGLGDTTLYAKYQLLSPQSIFAIAIEPVFVIPTGNHAMFLSNSSFGGGLRFIAEKTFSPLNVAANIGFEYYRDATYLNVDYRKTIPMALGFDLTITPAFGLNLEGAATFLTTGKWGQYDVYLGGNLRVFDGGLINVGMSLANVETDGTIDARFLVGLKVLPWKKPDPKPITEGRYAEAAKVVTKTVTVNCGVKKWEKTFPSRELTAEELSKQKVLPYQNTPTHKLPIYKLGQSTGLTSNQTPYVKGAQVIFAIDLVDLPPRKVIVGVDGAKLSMQISRVHRDGDDEEILCFLDQRVCSGEQYRQKAWLSNINNDFFNGRETPNDFFVKKSLGKRTAEIPGAGVYSGFIDFPIDRLIENAPNLNVLGLLYGQSEPTKAVAKRTLFIAAADDFYVGKETELSVVLKEDTCQTSESESTRDAIVPVKTSGPPSAPASN